MRGGSRHRPVTRSASPTTGPWWRTRPSGTLGWPFGRWTRRWRCATRSAGFPRTYVDPRSSPRTTPSRDGGTTSPTCWCWRLASHSWTAASRSSGPSSPCTPRQRRWPGCTGRPCRWTCCRAGRGCSASGSASRSAWWSASRASTTRCCSPRTRSPPRSPPAARSSSSPPPRPRSPRSGSCTWSGTRSLPQVRPGAAVQLVTGGPAVGATLTTDRRIGAVSFTGSAEVGHRIARDAAPTKVLLELGSNAALVVAADADLAAAADAVVRGGYYASGQACISVQRVLVVEPCASEFLDAAGGADERRRRRRPTGSDDPGVGAHRRRAPPPGSGRGWTRRSRGGATVVCGGDVRDSVLEPTVLVDVPDRRRRSGTRRSSARSSRCGRCPISSTRSTRSTTPATGCTPACSPRPWRRRSRRSTGWRSAVSWSTRCPASGPT